MSRTYRAVVVLAVLVVGGQSSALAQSDPAAANTVPAVTSQQPPVTDAAVPAQPASSAAAPSLVNPSLGATFTSIGGDLRQMFSRGSVPMTIAFAGSALFASHWDAVAVGEVRELPSGTFKAGNRTGALATQMGIAFGTFAIGKATGNSRIATTGSHLIRAQIASQVVVQGLKLAAGRTRPDSSNQMSFPSGHSAAAFATATVLQRDFGWKVGIPAYAVGAYVAASRMGSNKHYLSDVIVGAAIGVTAGRAVTIGSGKARFDLGLAPTAGGAAVTFTKKN
jgi:membrane-associated phospholipid phosphatase